jgi:hypothetical protein
MKNLNYNLQRIKDSEDRNTDVEKLGFYIKDSRYHIKRNGKGSAKAQPLEISNFVGKSLYNLDNGTNASSRIIQLQRYTSESYLVEIPTSDMKLEPFEVILKSKQCTFYGNRNELNQIFSHWMDNESQAHIIDVLGYNSNFNIYAFSNAVFCINKKQLYNIDELGIVKTSDSCFYLPANGKANINNDEYEQYRKFYINTGNIGFEQWSKLYYNTYKSNGAIAINYLILSLFWDIVFEQVGFFPFLFLFGAFGTGKTSLVKSLLKLFGHDYIGIPLNNASQVGLSRTIASRNNTIFYLKEYTQDSDKSNESLILTAYDGSGRTTGIKSNDNRTQVASVKSAIIFDGNHLPAQNSAVLSRMILLNFENNQFTKAQRDALYSLEQYNEEGVGQIIIEILQHREYFSKNFRATFDKVIEEIRNIDTQDFSERMFKHIALILTPTRLLGEKFQFPFSYTELKEIAIENAVEQTNILKQTNECAIFWEAFAYNVQKGNLIQFLRDQMGDNRKTSHYNVKMEDEILQIRFSSVYAEYVRFCKSCDEKIVGKSTLKKLLTSKSYKPFIPNAQKGRGDAYTDAAFGSCYQFRIEVEGSNQTIDGVSINL